jgi:flagellin
MSLGILNNIAALYAENNLNSTQASLQTTLQQLSSGSRINSGADDPAGLAVSDGLGANEAALTQSSQNASDGIGLLQTADGALSQVTSLLDQAVTLATESANGTLTSGQVSSANQEYQNILAQIGNIGSTTNFNSSNVFSASATNIVVTDGTSSGLNTYADTVGALTTASVGTTAATAPSTSTPAPVSTAPVAAINNAAGVYTLTANNATDTLGGTLSWTVGASTTPTSITVAAGSSLTTVAGQLTTAGLASSVSNGVITITGPTSGANAAANTVSFTSSLSDTPKATTLGSAGAVGTAANTGTAATGSLTSTLAANGSDTFAGTIILTQGGTSKTVTIAASSSFGLASNAASVQGQITAQLAGTTFALGTDGGTAVNPILNFTGASNTTAITTTGTFANTTASTSGVITDNAGVAGVAVAQGTFVLGALGSATDSYGAGTKLDINGTTIDVSGDTAAAAKLAINNNATFQGLGVSASVASGTTLTINGNSNGSALTVLGNLGGPLAVYDQAANNAAITSIGQSTAPVGTLAVGGKSVITLGSAGDTLSGTLTEIVNTNASAKTATLAVATGTTGAQLATQINQNASFIAAGLSAVYNSTNATVTLTGPTGAGNTIASTGTSLTDTSSALPGVGANFTAAAVSTLTASTASTVLTTVTSAVADVAYQRGTIGADVNELTSASNVASAEEVNLTSAQDTITATDYGAAASNLSKYQILSQTGISALAQANSVQQEVLKLLQ